ncbi:MAG: hypothetical protein ACTSWW_10355 [Promethearchaeota archaeon]
MNVNLKKKMEKDNPARQQWVLGISGGVLMALSTLLLAFKVNPPWLVRTIETEAGYVDVTFTFVLWLLLFIVGSGLVRQSIIPKSTTHPENALSFHPKTGSTASDHSLELRSFPVYHLLAGILLLLLSIVQFLEWGADFSFDNGEGNWVFLGGPSLWYATGFFSIIFALILFGYVVGAKKHIGLQDTGKSYDISETRWLFVNRQTDIPKEDIRAIFISNNKTAVRFLWILPLGLHLYYLEIDAFAYLCNPMAFSRGYITGGYYLLQAVADLVALGLILCAPLTIIEVHTSDKRYVLKCALFTRGKSTPKGKDLITKFGTLFEIPSDQLTHEYHRSGWTLQLVTGGFFLLVAILSRVFNFYAGELLRLALIFAGFVFIIRSVKAETTHYHFGEKNATDPTLIDGLTSGRRGRYHTLSYFLPHSANTTHDDTGYRSRDLIDYLIAGLLPILMIWEVISVIIYVPPSFSGYTGMIFIQILLSGVIFGLLVWMYFKKRQRKLISLGYAEFSIEIGGEEINQVSKKD